MFDIDKTFDTDAVKAAKTHKHTNYVLPTKFTVAITSNNTMERDTKQNNKKTQLFRT